LINFSQDNDDIIHCDDPFTAAEHQGIWNVVCVLYYKCAVTTLAYSPAQKYVSVGLDDGRIFTYAVSNTFHVVEETSYHKYKVTGMHLDPATNYLISCSVDKTICVFDMVKKEVIATQERMYFYPLQRWNDLKHHLFFVVLFHLPLPLFTLLR